MPAAGAATTATAVAPGAAPAPAATAALAESTPALSASQNEQLPEAEPAQALQNEHLLELERPLPELQHIQTDPAHAAVAAQGPGSAAPVQASRDQSLLLGGMAAKMCEGPSGDTAEPPDCGGNDDQADSVPLAEVAQTKPLASDSLVAASTERQGYTLQARASPPSYDGGMDGVPDYDCQEVCAAHEMF